MELLILLFGALLLVSVLGRVAGRRRRAYEEEQRRRAEELARRESEGGPAIDPFAGFPLGGLFGDLLTGGTWSRQYEWDPERGWVEVGHEQPEPMPAPTVEDERPADARRRKREARRAQTARSSGGFDPLEMLGGHDAHSAYHLFHLAGRGTDHGSQLPCLDL